MVNGAGPGAETSRAAGLSTTAVHAGRTPDQATGAVVSPIYMTSTYVQDGIARPRGGWTYSRVGNPTRTTLELALAEIEGARFASCFSSGLAAASMVADLVHSGEHIIAERSIYGGTFRLFESVLRNRGIDIDYVDVQSAVTSGDLRDRVNGRTRMIWIESPTNPLLKLIDIAAVRTIMDTTRGARGEPPLLIVDGTFATPAFQHPLALGAHVVYHSASKFFSGHSDAVHGVAMTDDAEIGERLHYLQAVEGAIPSPFDCFLVLRGLQTFPLRMEKHTSNALAVADYLAARRDVDSVFYPGHEHTGPAQMELAARQMSGTGAILSFTPAPTGSGRSAASRAVQICESTRLFRIADSCGGVESLISLPTQMSHASMVGTEFEISDSLVRLSCGIEDPADLIADIGQALDRAI